MAVIETRLKKWGNSFGLIIPKEIVERENMKEEGELRVVVIKKNSSKVLHETFGMGKGKITKSGQQLKDEARRELY